MSSLCLNVLICIRGWWQYLSLLLRPFTIGPITNIFHVLAQNHLSCVLCCIPNGSLTHACVYLCYVTARDIFSPWSNFGPPLTEIQPILQTLIRIPSSESLLQLPPPPAIPTASELTFRGWTTFPITSYLLLSWRVINTCDSSLYSNVTLLRAKAVCIVIVFQES